MSEVGVPIPDRFGEVIGWRAWKVMGPPRHPRLFSVTWGNTLWPTREWTVAQCRRGHTDVPMEGCSCGLYAARTREHLVGLGYNVYYDGGEPVVIGQVGLTGKVIPGTQGWRAEKGRIVRLYVPHDFWRLAKPLGEAYRVPVELSNTFAAESVA